MTHPASIHLLGCARFSKLTYHPMTQTTPKIYRTMFDDGGKPRVGQKRCMLGVRPPGTPSTPDVDLEANGDVTLNNKGMPVFRSLADVPLKLMPLHLSPRVRGAAGPLNAHIWSIGTGPFASGAVTDALRLHAPGGPHGNVCPAHAMPLATFQQELVVTRDSWKVDEP